MRINNFGEFKTFLIENNMDNLNTDICDFIACVSQYNCLCVCKKTQKTQKGEICNNLYKNIVVNILPRYKDLIFEKIKEDNIDFFYNQNWQISTLNR